MLRLRGGCGGISPEARRDNNEGTEIQGSPEDIYVEDSDVEESPELNTINTEEDLAVQETPDDIVVRGPPEHLHGDQDHEVTIEEYSESLFNNEHLDDAIEEYSESVFLQQNPDELVQYRDSMLGQQKPDSGLQQNRLSEQIVSTPENIIIEDSSSEEDREEQMIPEFREDIGDEHVQMQEALKSGCRDGEKSTRRQLDSQEQITVNRTTAEEERTPAYDNYGSKFLKNIDKHFAESPRLLMRGIWRSDELELQVKRKPEGVLVQWLLTNTRSNKIVFNAMAQMTYKSRLALSSQYGSDLKQFGYAVKGGWAWDGFGYGFVNLNRLPTNQQNLFPLSDSSIKHLDLEEAVFPDESVRHHISGANCKNIDKDKSIDCQEDGCGIEISKLTIQSFSTVVDKPDSWELVHNLKRHEFKEQVFVSLVVFPSSGDYKVLLHMDSKEKPCREVAWMAKANVRFDDQPGVDRCKIDRHQYIWRTGCPKIVMRKSRSISIAQNDNQRTSEHSEHSATHMNPLYDLSRALSQSRKTLPKGMTQKEMVEVGMKFMAGLGVQCEWPETFIPADGDCLWSSIAR